MSNGDKLKKQGDQLQQQKEKINQKKLQKGRIEGKRDLQPQHDSYFAELFRLGLSRNGRRDVTLKSDAVLSTKERAERKRVAKPKDGVGCPHGGLSTGKEKERWWRELAPEKKAAILDPNTITFIRAYASRSGPAEYNQQLSEKRGKDMKKWLVEKKGAHPASFELKGYGEKEAKKEGRSDGKDSHKDRIVLIDILPGTKTAEKDMDKSAKDESMKKGITTIPPEFTRDYKMDRGWAENKWRKTYHAIRIGAKGRVGMVIESFRQINDAGRYRRDMERARNNHEKIWGVKPMRGFSFDIKKPSVQMRIKTLLRQGDYDVESMYKEYIIHWLRKGAK